MTMPPIEIVCSKKRQNLVPWQLTTDVAQEFHLDPTVEFFHADMGWEEIADEYARRLPITDYVGHEMAVDDWIATRARFVVKVRRGAYQVGDDWLECEYRWAGTIKNAK